VAETEVCITVDTEFDVNGALSRPGEREPLGAECVYRIAKGRSQGLGVILDTLEHYGLRGTFFIEVLNTRYFGDGPMGSIAGEIATRGHDLQLHAHPCWRYLAGRKAGTVGPDQFTDSFAALGDAEQIEVLEESREIFRRLTGREALAFRSGGLFANRGLFDALRKTGFKLSSTLGLGVYRPQEAELQLRVARRRIGGVTEVPVLSYRPPQLPGLPGEKCATLIGSSWAELRSLLAQAAARGAGPLVLLTHASEYSRDAGTPMNRSYTPAPRVQARLDSLCRFLSRYPKRYRVVTFSEAYSRWIKAPDADDLALRSSVAGLGLRLLENNLLPRLGLH